MNRKIVIVCDDKYGLDIFTIIESINANYHGVDSIKYETIGFISDRSDPFENFASPAPLLGRIEDYENKDGLSVVLAIKDPNKKEAVVKQLKSKGAIFETIIAPWALLPFEFEVGEGCIIANYNCKHKSKFGNFVIMDTAMCETVEVGDYSTVCPFVNLTNGIVGKSVYIGSHSVIMVDRTVGDGAYIYPGSIVVKNIKPGSVVAGVPATAVAVKNWGDKRIK